MPHWPATRMTLLDRLRDRRNQEAWAEFVALYGPQVFQFARRRLPQDDDAADVLQEVLTAILRGTYQRPSGRFQKWLVTVILNQICKFHATRLRRAEVSCDWIEEPSREEEEEWDQERRRYLFRAAAEHVRVRSSDVHWEVFVRTAIENESCPDIARVLGLSLTNVYAIRSRLLKEIRDEVHRLEEG